MIDHVDLPGALRSFRTATVLQTALAFILTLGDGWVFVSRAALADPITVQPVTLPSFADLADKVGPAVVSVRVRLLPTPVATQPAPALGNGAAPIPPQTQRGGTALGSGFFITGDGYVVTNNHVVDDAQTYTVITSDGTEYPAKLIGKDSKTDLALLKVDATAPFPYVKWADDAPRIGDWVVAIGNPFGLGGTVTMGIVSARGRQISSGIYDDYLQIDAPINRGNSGGPSFNTKGEVVGINTAIYSTSGGNVGIAFDIPSSDAAPIIALLKANGAILRGWLGVQTQTVTSDIADSLKLAPAKGAMVAQPQSGSPADMAGILAGDVITAVDGKPIGDPRDLALLIAGDAPNTTVQVSVWRNGMTQNIAVKLGTLPPDPTPVAAEAPPPRNGGAPGGGGPGGPNAPGAAPGGGPGGPAPGVAPGGTGPTGPGGSADSGAAHTAAPDGTSFPDYGMTIAAAGNQVSGVNVFDVTPDGIADKAGLSDGDLIVAVGGMSVTSAADVQTAINAAKQTGAKAILLRLQQGHDTEFLAIPLG